MIDWRGGERGRRFGGPPIVFWFFRWFRRELAQHGRGRRADGGDHAATLERVVLALSVLGPAVGPGVALRPARHIQVSADEAVEQGLWFDPEIIRVGTKEAADIDRRGQFVELLGFQRLQEPRRDARILGDLVDA